MDGLGLAVALDQRENRVEWPVPCSNFGSGFAADKVISASKVLPSPPIGGWRRSALHDLADAVHQEPSGFHAAIERALNLPGTDALLAGGDELDRLQPQMQREMAVLENGADPHREGLPAGVTLAQAGPATLAVRRPFRFSSQFPQWGQTGPSGRRWAST